MAGESKPSPGGGTDRGKKVPPGHYAPIARDARFRLLRRRFRRLVWTITVSFLGWYFLYVALSAFARGFMARPLFGNVNVALLLGVLQFVSTFALTWGYTVYARRTLDPLSAALRAGAAGEPAPVVPRQRPGHEPAAREGTREAWAGAPGIRPRPDLGGLR